MDYIIQKSDNAVIEILKASSSSTSNNEQLINDDCPICREHIQALATIEPCGHIFDAECIEIWIETSSGAKTCPCCRTEMEAIETTDFMGMLFTTEIPTGVTRRVHYPGDMRQLEEISSDPYARNETNRVDEMLMQLTTFEGLPAGELNLPEAELLGLAAQYGERFADEHFRTAQPASFEDLKSMLISLFQTVMTVDLQ